MMMMMIFKKRRRDDTASDSISIVDDVIAEFAPDDTDRERHGRRVQPKPNSNSNSSTGANGAASRINSIVASGGGGDVESARVVNDDGGRAVRENVFLNEEGAIDDGKVFVFGTENYHASSIEQVPSNGDDLVEQKVVKKDIDVEEAKAKPETKEEEEVFTMNDGSLPFFILDAHEEFHGVNRGTLYLFGKVKVGNLYQSCCVVVKNMQRCVYSIPSHPLQNTDEMMKDVANEISKHLLDLNVSTFSLAAVKDPVLPVDLKGESFCALLGTHCSALELFLIQREIKKGPSWLQVSNFSTCSASQRVSWCKFEVTVDSPSDIRIPELSKISFQIPPVVVTAIDLKTIINEKLNVNEIISASIVYCNMVKIDTPMLASEWERPGMLTYFTVICKLDGNIFPLGFSKEVMNKNSKAGSTVLCVESCERALLNRLMTELHKLDSDVLVGHNISGFDLEVLLRRSQACEVPSNMWSKLGRLKRSALPKLDRGSNNFGSGARPVILSCIVGRLLCDTYLCSRDLLKKVSYSLTELAKTRLNNIRQEVAPHDVPKKFQSAESLNELAQRVEYLLLHEFHAKGYLVPDKTPSLAKETKLMKRKVTHGVEDSNFDEADVDDTNYDNDVPDSNHKKSKKAPSYAGGLVLEPKKGLYDKYVLLLDFNSLYPTIIQEYNICFTTVERSSDGSFPRLPSNKTTGVLPVLLKDLVDRRKRVKSKMKTASEPEVHQLDILQQALKLTANSVYGCLGFFNSRFYAKPLAELITLQGREILQSTVDLVQNNLNLEVIYGDTDSIMIYSGLDDIAKAKAMARKVIQEVNKKYRCLEIDLDGLYKRMLLLKKKKYAAIKVQLKDATSYEEVTECKGLDIVCREWSELAQELGKFCLSQILSGGSCEDVVESIHSSLMKVQEEMRNGQVPVEKYVIHKTLTKPLNAYPDAKNQPHVLVVQRLKQHGYSFGCSVGDPIPYIICYESAMGIAQRARHHDELKREQGKWLIDIDYYLSQQIHPVVSHLCASIQGTSPGRLADYLGLDSSKFQHKSSEASSSDPTSSLLFAANDERYRGCEPLVLSCPSCSDTFDCPPVFKSVCLLGSERTSSLGTEESNYNFWHKLRCAKCPEDGFGRISPAMIANQCDDETCQHTTRSTNLRLRGDSERGTVCPNYPQCNGRLHRKMEAKSRMLIEKELMKVRPIVDLAASTVRKIRDRCGYGWVKLPDLVVTV